MPALLKVLQGNAGGYDTSIVLGHLDRRDIDALAPQWAATATDPRVLPDERLAALRALQVFGPMVAAQGPVLRPLALGMTDAKSGIRDQAIDVLQTMGDEAGLPALAKTCHRTSPYDKSTADYATFVANDFCIGGGAALCRRDRGCVPDFEQRQ